MASWDPFYGWQTINRATNYKTDYSGEDYASSFPYPDPNSDAFKQTKTIYVNKTGNVVFGVDTVAHSGWTKYTLTDSGGGAGSQIPGLDFSRLSGAKDENGNDLTWGNIVDRDIVGLQTNRSLAINAANEKVNEYRHQAADTQNKINETLNAQNKAVNDWSANTVKTLSNAKDGSYKTTLENLDTSGLSGLNATDRANLIEGAVNSFDAYYLEDVLVPWDIASLDASALNPPVGTFDVNYYKLNTQGGQTATKQWDDALTAVSSPAGVRPDLDIIGRYGGNKDTYTHWYYVTQGKPSGERGNRARTAFSGANFESAKEWAKAQADPGSAWYQGLSAEDKQKVEKGELFSPEVNEWYAQLTPEEQASFNDGTLPPPMLEADLKGVNGLNTGYSEYLTDADYQEYRDRVLGLSDRFDNIADWADAQDPEVLQEWYNSLPSYQKEEYNAGTLAVPTLDFIPDRLRDQVVMSKGGSTLLEGKIAPVLGEKELEQEKVFASLTNDSLKMAAMELQKAKAQEQEYDFYAGMTGVNEILSINETLANSLLGDTGIGGVLAWMGSPEQTQENLEKSLSGATGVPSRNSAIYNWQKWFDEQLTPRYQEGLEVTDPLAEGVTYTIDADFAKDYVDRYLKPRFDTSRSMSEFISYMDVEQNEQNIFQTQSALDSLRDIANLRSRAYLDGVKSTDPLNFNTDFYFNPQGNFLEGDPKSVRYTSQTEQVAADWETAKTKGDSEKVPGTDYTWNQWAYYYGLDPTDRNQFAQLHYQVKGRAEGFDPAKDLITMKDAEDYIDGTIIPLLVDEKLNIGDVTFLNFVTPEEYADKLLEGISPEEHKEEWDKLLETLGLSEEDMGIAEVKEYIIEAFRTGAAQEIRESIKYLNEKKLQPTQERLGVEYIERPEDYQPTDDPDATELYKIFQNAGYQGSEDDFYNDFMTDVDRSEMQLLTQASKKGGLQSSTMFSGLTSNDPFESLVSLQGLFDDDSAFSVANTKEEEPAPSYFKLFQDDDEDEDYKSASGQKVLNEFTSLFKGFS